MRSHDSSSGVSDQQSVGSSPDRDTCVLKQDTYIHDCFIKVGEVVLSALLARLLVDDSHGTYIHISVKCVGNPVSAPGVAGNGPRGKF